MRRTASRRHFLSALRAYPRLQVNSNLRAWVLTIAHRKAIDTHRARGRRPMPVEASRERGGGSAPGARRSPLGCGRELPSKQRAAIVCSFANDLARRHRHVLGCSEEAARRNVHEGVSELREVLVK